MLIDEVPGGRRKMRAEERLEFDRAARIVKPVWLPTEGSQALAYWSKADVIGYGGAAGGGKTDLALGLALTKHTRSAIFRREATQLTGVIERLAEILGHRAGLNAHERIWRLRDKQIEFGSAPHPGDEARYQGRAKDLLVLDEATNFLESQARFLMGWVRTHRADQKCTTLLTFNPPTSAEGRWVIPFFGPWLDPAHPNPAADGELRWFATVKGKDLEVAEDRPFVLDGEAPVYDFDPCDHAEAAIIRPVSRTFVRSRLADNPYLTRTGYLATLQAMPEPLRSQMLEGDFSAGVADDRWQVIPSAWVDAAMARWRPRLGGEGASVAQEGGSSQLGGYPGAVGPMGPMDSLGVDVARGGRDQTIIARRCGAWFDRLICLEGAETPDGPSLAGQVMAARRDRAVVHIDVVGWGASPYDFLSANGIQTVGVNGAARTAARSREARIPFVNRRAELWWRMREALDPNGEEPIALPPDPALKADLCAPRWRQALSGIQIEAKEDVAARIGRSPDRGDAACLALMATPKAGAGLRRGARTSPVSWMG